MFEIFVTRILSPLLVDLIFRLVQKYVKDAVFRGMVDDAVKMAKAAQSEEEVQDAAKALHDAINS